MRRILLIFAALSVIAGGAARAEPLPPRAFAAVFAAAVVKAMPGAKVTVIDDFSVETRGPAGGRVNSDLRNAYDLYLVHPTDLDAILQIYVDPLAGMIENAKQERLPLDRSRIVPVFKSRRWLEGVRQELIEGKVDQAQLLTEPYNDELTIIYAEDAPAAMRFLTTRDDVGDRSKLHDLAIANLGRLLPKIEMRAGDDGIFLIEAGGDYEAGLLLFDDIWSSGQIKVDGDIVVAVPAKDALIVTGSRNRAGLERMRVIAAQLAHGAYGLTPVLLVYRNGKFVRFDN